jgi:hypothetical protein
VKAHLVQQQQQQQQQRRQPEQCQQQWHERSLTGSSSSMRPEAPGSIV